MIPKPWQEKVLVISRDGNLISKIDKLLCGIFNLIWKVYVDIYPFIDLSLSLERKTLVIVVGSFASNPFTVASLIIAPFSLKVES